MTRHFTELSDLGNDGLVRLLDAADRWLETRGSGARTQPRR